MFNHLTQHCARHQSTQIGDKLLHWRCHYYGKFGHIKPFYFKLYGYPKYLTQPRANQVATNPRREWILKPVNTSLISHTSLRASAREDWYFDIGCSRHMTGVKTFLENIKSYSTAHVTFGDGDKGEIKEVRRLAYT